MPEFLEERLPEEVRTGAHTRSAYQVQITRTAGQRAASAAGLEHDGRARLDSAADGL